MIIIQKHLEVCGNEKWTKINRDELYATLVNSKSSKSNKTRVTEKIPAAGNTKGVEIAVPLK